MGNRVGTLTRPNDTKEITSVFCLEPYFSLLSTIIRSIVRVWQVSDSGVRHED